MHKVTTPATLGFCLGSFSRDHSSLHFRPSPAEGSEAERLGMRLLEHDLPYVPDDGCRRTTVSKHWSVHLHNANDLSNEQYLSFCAKIYEALLPVIKVMCVYVYVYEQEHMGNAKYTKTLWVINFVHMTSFGHHGLELISKD